LTKAIINFRSWVITVGAVIMAPENLQYSSDLYKLQVASLSKLCSVVVDASNLLSLISKHYSSEVVQNNYPDPKYTVTTMLNKVVIAGRNFLLSDVDSSNINSAQAAIKEALESLKSSVVTVQAVQNFKSTLSKLDEVLQPVDFTETRRLHLSKFSSGS